MLMCVIAIALVLIVLFVIREFVYGFRHHKLVQKFLPHKLIEYGVISLEEWELTDTEKEYSEEVLQAVKEWMYRHTESEKNQLIVTLAENFDVFNKDPPLLLRRHNTLLKANKSPSSYSLAPSRVSMEMLGEYAANSHESDESTEMRDMQRLNSVEKISEDDE